MRIRLPLFVLFFLASITAGAQDKTYFGGGASVIRSSSYDPSPKTRNDGGQVSAGAYVEAGYDLRHGFQALALVEYQSKPTYQSIFTSDSNTGRVATSELRFRTEIRYTFATEHYAAPFVAFGQESTKQYFKPTKPQPLPGPLPPIAAYAESQEYGRHSVSLNPYFTIGVDLGKSHEIAFTRLLDDRLTDSGLNGYRASYTHTKRLGNHVSLRFSVEADRQSFRDTVGDYLALYRKNDTAIRGRVGLSFH